MTRYLEHLGTKWGEITQSMLDRLTVRAVDQPDFTDALILPVTCAQGHSTHLVIVGTRLYFFIWRVNMLLASYWDLDENGVLVPKEPTTPWPPAELIDQLATAVRMYFGHEELSAAGFGEFNEVVLGSHPFAAWTYTMMVEIAELFLLCHEFHHIEPGGIHVVLPSDLPVSTDRLGRWQTEVMCDSNSVYVLLIAATQALAEQFGLSGPDARMSAAGLVVTGADAALHTLVNLERTRYGDVSLERASSDRAFELHPPASIRRDWFSVFSRDLVVRELGMDDATWTVFRDSVASQAHIRDQLFEEFMRTRHEVVTEARQ